MSHSDSPYRYASLPADLGTCPVHADISRAPTDDAPRVQLWIGDLYIVVDRNTAREIRVALEGVDPWPDR